jgi:hypothetical protein
MTQEFQQVLTTFDSLSDAEKHLAVAELMRRTWPQGGADLPEEALVEAAESLFAELDSREAGNAQD